jgi:SAM-dependent methyltransferase
LNARCPRCGSLERHRLIWKYFASRTDLLDGGAKRVLHVAPEPQLGSLLQRLPGVDYLSIDLAEGAAMARMDVTDLALVDDSFDVIICSHVLEHVPDDRRAMRELFRVLRPGGWAILQVPIVGDRTYEDWSVTMPEDRERVFGQRDHVRIYGRDYVNRLVETGFDVCEDSLPEQGDPRAARYYGLCPDEPIHFCRKGETVCRERVVESDERPGAASHSPVPSAAAGP